MTLVKPIAAIGAGIAVSALLFLGMAVMVAPPDGFTLDREEPVLVDFSSRRQDSSSETRSRNKPPPPPETPMPPQATSQNQAPTPVTAPALSLSPLSPDLSIGEMATANGLLPRCQHTRWPALANRGHCSCSNRRRIRSPWHKVAAAVKYAT